MNILISLNGLEDKTFLYTFLFLGLLVFFLVFISDKVISIFEKIWDEEDFFSSLDIPDSSSEFSDLDQDQSIIQIVMDTNVRFDDVAGNEEGKQELIEVVRFLENPDSFAKLGAGIPKGVLLDGPPGTGKTLLAKAIAGEAEVPFLKVSGSQFVELLVGIGAARVRELFETARSLKPCIIFIDEIDSIARVRSSNNGMGGGNDEREQTLNQILTEMDGFQVDSGVVVIAATNRSDILDPAIKRPGRFDREITISNPNLAERIAILNVHAKNKKFDSSVSIPVVAQSTMGFSGADLANLLNEAAILATRRKKNVISMDEITTSINRLLLGLEGKRINRIKVRYTLATYEIAQALIGLLVYQNKSIEKITIIPRGNQLATGLTTPSPSQYTSKKEFIQEILVDISGRAAEDIINGEGECTTGAQEDLSKITRTIREMVVRYAMTRLQEFKQPGQETNPFLLGSDVKEELNNLVDNYTTHFIFTTYNHISSFLMLIRPILERIIDQLLIDDELSGDELRALAREYFANNRVKKIDLLEIKRQALLYELLAPRLDIIEFLKSVENFKERLNQEIKNAKKSKE